MLDLDLTQVDPNQVTAELCRRSLIEFMKETWPQVELGYKYKHNWHLDCIADHLANIYEIRNLLIVAPPRVGKTLLIDVFFPAWMWTHSPTTQFRYTSYCNDLAEDASRKCRMLLQCERYRELYPEVQLSETVNTKNLYETTKGGRREAGSIAGGLTGKGHDIGVMSEPHNVRAVEFEGDRQTTIHTFWSAWMNRVNDATRCGRIVVCQRTHKHDLAASILERNQGEWTVLTIPYDYQHDRSVCLGWPALGHMDPRTEVGQPLWPERFPEHEIRQYKRNRAHWATQYNQDPKESEDSLFNSENLHYFTEDEDTYFLGDKEVQKADCFRLMACDLAATAKKTSDYSAVVTADVSKTGDIIVIHSLRERISSGKLSQTIATLKETLDPWWIMVEYTNFDAIIVDELKMAGLPVKGVKTQVDKRTKSMPLQIKFENGQVWFPKDSKPWVDVMEEELINFTGEKNGRDDVVDCLAMLAAEGNKRTRFKARPKVEKPVENSIEEEDKRFWALMMQGTED